MSRTTLVKYSVNKYSVNVANVAMITSCKGVIHVYMREQQYFVHDAITNCYGRLL